MDLNLFHWNYTVYTAAIICGDGVEVFWEEALRGATNDWIHTTNEIFLTWKGHHLDLQEKVTRFHSSLLKGSVEGIDLSILIKPRRLHFTLGVMSLSSSSNGHPRGSNRDSANPSSSSAHTVESALELLRSLQPQLSMLCSIGKTGSLQASLEKVGTFGTNKGSRVLWASPREDEEGWSESEGDREERLKLVRVAEMVHQAFKDAKYIIEERPLKAVSSASDGTVRVSLGTYDIPEIQLCAMGSHGPEDQYISLGGVSFSDDVGQR
ncbi:hypothetical protein BT96DRAFT_933040 [Gymnopus androsaceus JB14]|uniref:A-kinase anchor protein 7-like phosphoesterase domain-containing protein n=1 Tax=Gymnopus androsaceus JB14 TaxID=1447944 RepID=A0A6A4IBJ7_9AGAR|nr:hypothetical protein BT96DRAFT_933040 [Gymnopus androsaceus JB14]